METKFKEGLSDQEKEDIPKVFRIFRETVLAKVGGKGLCNERGFPVGWRAEITWACAWNKPADVGRIVTVIATQDELCMIAVDPGDKAIELPSSIYQAEDLLAIPPAELGLPVLGKHKEH